jgi:hypothetical protein
MTNDAMELVSVNKIQFDFYALELCEVDMCVYGIDLKIAEL